MSAYFAPTTLAQALALKVQVPQARWLAGGTDELVQLRQGPGSAAPPSLIDITRVPELHGIWVEAGWLHLGAASSFAQIAVSPLVAAYASVLQQAALTVGGPAIRNMGTLGGNLCSASPAADALPPLVVLQAQLALTSAACMRHLAVADFVTGPRQTRLASDELLTRISLPLVPAFSDSPKSGCASLWRLPWQALRAGLSATQMDASPKPAWPGAAWVRWCSDLPSWRPCL